MLKSRLLRLLLWAAAALGVLWVLAWFGVPALLKWQLESRGSQALGRELRVGEVRFVPHALALTLRDLSVAGADAAAPPQLHIERIFVDLDVRSLWRLAPVVEALEIDAPHARLTRLAPGRYDIDDILQRLAPPQPPPQPPSEMPRFALFNVRVAGGELQFDDRPVARQHQLRQLVLDLPFLSNLPDDLLVKVEPRLAFELNGSAFENQGRSTPFAEGRASEFEIRFDQLDLQPMWAYAPDGLPLRPGGGKLSADLNLRFEQPRQSGPRVQLKGQVEVRDFRLQPPGDAPLLAWQGLRVRLADVWPLQHRVALDEVQLDGAVLHLRREASGALELERLAAAFAAPRDAGRAPAAHALPASGATGASAPSAATGASAPSPATGVSAGAANTGASAVAAATGASAASAATGASAASAAPGAPAAPGWQLQLARLALKGATVHWSDAAVQPAAEVQLDGIDVQLEQLTWPTAGDARLRADARLVAQDRPSGQVHAEGVFTDRQAKVDVRAEGIDLAAVEPYLRQYLHPQASAKLAAKASVDWARGDAPRLLVQVPMLQVDDFRLAEPAARGARAPAPLAQLARLEVSDVRADLLGHRVGVGSLALQRPTIDLARDRDGRLNVQQWLKQADTPATRAADAGPPWRLELREFKVDGGRARLADAALPSGPLELSGLRVLAQGLAWPLAPGAAPLNTQLAASLSPAGKADTAARVDWRGRVSPEPMGVNGQLRVERFPVHVFEPYFGAQLPVSLQRLEAGFQGQVEAQQQAQGLTARLRGDALLADLRVVARGAVPADGKADAAADLLRWNALNLNRLDVGLQPGAKPRIDIGELRLADFFTRLEITEEGRFNLQTLTARPADAASAPARAAAAAPASAPAPARAAGDSVLSRLPVDLLVESMQFSNGRVDFQDHFIRPNYRADLSELSGRVGRLDSRSRDMATLQFSGRVGGTGLLEIGGAVNPTVIPPALDIKAKAHEIELPGLTPYSAKYAGYPIERGKLSVDVAYKIDATGKLEASNQIVVNQLTFGPKTDSPDATKLPVPLVVALLQDKNGVIDLDIPLTGSINDPQFSLGALIWKVVTNLFSKLVSSPFSVIGGGGKDLSTVEFRPGTATLAASGEEVIARVAKALDARPALKLGIAATADPVSERQAMQQAAFEARLRDEQRRERGRGALGSSGTDAPLPPLSAEQRARLVRAVYDDTKLPDKPRNFIGMAKDIPVADMEAMLVAAMPVDEAAARQLAVQRGRSVREALMAKGLPGSRLFLAEPKLREPSADNAPWVPQAQLTLSAG